LFIATHAKAHTRIKLPTNKTKKGKTKERHVELGNFFHQRFLSGLFFFACSNEAIKSPKFQLMISKHDKKALVTTKKFNLIFQYFTGFANCIFYFIFLIIFKVKRWF
jgi:hypothetical protein